MSEYIDRESIRKVLMDVCSDENCPMFIAATIDRLLTMSLPRCCAGGAWTLDQV